MKASINKTSLEDKQIAIEQLLQQIKSIITTTNDKPAQNGQEYENVEKIIQRLNWELLEERNPDFGQDSFFYGEDGLLKTIKESPYWNESIKNILEKINERKDGFSDSDELTIFDAGNSFEKIKKEEDEEGKEILITPHWVEPWKNRKDKTYFEVRDEDKNVYALSDQNRLDFTQEQGKYFRLLLPQNKRRVEVEDLNRNFWTISQGISTLIKDLFEEDGILQYSLKGIIKELGQLWENCLYLWATAIIETQEVIYSTHAEVVYLDYNNFDSNIYTGMKYDNFDFQDIEQRTDEDVIEKIQYLKNIYPKQNLVILPIIRTNNYEHNYYSAITLPGLFLYDVKEDEWKQKTFPDDEWYKFDGFDYLDSTYGIIENKNKYYYACPCSNLVAPEKPIRGHNLIGEKVTWNTVDFAADIFELTIDFFDIGKRVIANETKENCLISSINFTTENDNIIANKTDEIISTSFSLREIEIKKGFYRGELISAYRDITEIQSYQAYVLPMAYLKPTTETQANFTRTYPTDEKAQTRREDALTLKAIIKNYINYHNPLVDFWRNKEDTYSYSQPYAFIDNVWLSAGRPDVPLKYGSAEKYYSNIDAWKQENENYYQNFVGQANQILFIEGYRQTEYISSQKEESNTAIYFPYFDNPNARGLTFPRFEAVSLGNVFAGAMVKVPTPYGDSYMFYDDYTCFNEERYGNVLRSSSYYVVLREGKWVKKDETSIDKNELLKSLPSEIMISGAPQAPYIEQHIILKKQNEELNLNNWLFCKVRGRYTIDYPLTPVIEAGKIDTFLEQIYDLVAIDNQKFLKVVLREAAATFFNKIRNATIEQVKIALDDMTWENPVFENLYKEMSETEIIDQIILGCQEKEGKVEASTFLWYKEQNEFYENQSLNWKNKVESLIEKWYQNVLNNSTYQLPVFNIEINEENELAYTEEKENNIPIVRYYVEPTISLWAETYVFGPTSSDNGEPIFAARAYPRDVDPTSEDFLKFTRDLVQERLSKNEENVDEIRSGYEVFSNSNKAINIEGLKAIWRKVKDQTSQNDEPIYVPDRVYDESPYRVQWQSDLKNWDEPIDRGVK